MIGMVLVTHGQLANGFRAALEHVVGPQSQFETIAIGPEDDMEQRRADILNAASRVQDGSGVVLLTDMFGGTPSNLAISAMDGGRIEVICGINLPMLIKLATLRDERRPRPRGDRGARRGTQIYHRRQQGPDRQMNDEPTRTSKPCPPPPDFRRRAGARAADRQPQGPARARDGEICAVRRAVRRRRSASPAAAKRSAAIRSWEF